MSEPKRLLEGGGSELERLLLASGHAARPSRATRWKTEALVLIAGLGFASTARAVGPLAQKTHAGALARYLAMGAFGGAAVWGVAHVATRPSANAVQDMQTAKSVHASPAMQPEAIAKGEEVGGAPAPAAADLSSRDSVEPSRAESTHGRSASRARGAASVASRTGAGSNDSVAAPSIGSEILELDRARASLAAGQARAAVSALDRYQQAFPKGALQQEALRLRIEALVALGDRPAARTLTARFESLYPNSPHAKRLHSLVDAP
jgi:hypothetical protein